MNLKLNVCHVQRKIIRFPPSNIGSLESKVEMLFFHIMEKEKRLNKKFGYIRCT